MGSTIVALENGPYMLETGGGFVVDGGETEEKEKVFLCRCGQSSNKPFCDGTHRRVGFAAPQAEVSLAG
jgi:CDGSH-type Zn-finger protein